ncbi:hypothetical protein BLSTO_06018 [Blastocystis sp. subtype 1]
MGNLNKDSYCFFYASLELKNLPSLKSLLFGDYTFLFCSRVMFENLSELTSIRLGISALKFHQYVNSTELIMRSGDGEMK